MPGELAIREAGNHSLRLTVRPLTVITSSLDVALIFAGDPRVQSAIITRHADLGGVHFTGGNDVFRGIWQSIAANLKPMRSFPRIVGETGGKDFVFVHASAQPDEVATALARGAAPAPAAGSRERTEKSSAAIWSLRVSITASSSGSASASARSSAKLIALSDRGV